ncbi:MAG: hypothetical protein A2Y07_01295 [Planctomycetes bacterium GWF2_50_10]|nr:MAG: hypothetical protein A2Y07_01295 [Planctomycetes bacterium GWF2_50_10]
MAGPTIRRDDWVRLQQIINDLWYNRGVEGIISTENGIHIPKMLSIGYSDPRSDMGLYVNQTNTGVTSSRYIAYFRMIYTPDGDASARSLCGVTSYPILQGDSTISNLYGMIIAPDIQHTSGTIGNAEGLRIAIAARAISGGSVSQIRCINIATVNKEAGSTENMPVIYGIRLEAMTPGDVNWQIYSIGGKWFVGGTDGIYFKQTDGSERIYSEADGYLNLKAGSYIKCTGTMQFGTYASGSSSITGYITIRDSGGTTRKLAVVA